MGPSLSQTLGAKVMHRVPPTRSYCLPYPSPQNDTLPARSSGGVGSGLKPLRGASPRSTPPTQALVYGARVGNYLGLGRVGPHRPPGILAGGTLAAPHAVATSFEWPPGDRPRATTISIGHGHGASWVRHRPHPRHASGLFGLSPLPIPSQYEARDRQESGGGHHAGRPQMLDRPPAPVLRHKPHWRAGPRRTDLEAK